MSKATVSVVMCVRNGEAYLAQALDSVAAQSGVAIEVVVVDDGSSDGSVQIAASHSCRPRIFRQDALGQPFAMNRGVAEARGTHVAFIDCDDVWPPGRLHALLSNAASDPDVDGIFGQIVNTDAVLQPITQPIRARMLTAGVISHALFARVGAFRTDIRHSSNVDWISRAVGSGARFAASEAVVLLRRVHGSNMGIVDVTKGRQDMLRVIRDHHARTRK